MPKKAKIGRPFLDPIAKVLDVRFSVRTTATVSRLLNSEAKALGLSMQDLLRKKISRPLK